MGSTILQLSDSTIYNNLLNTGMDFSQAICGALEKLKDAGLADNYDYIFFHVSQVPNSQSVTATHMPVNQ